MHTLVVGRRNLRIGSCRGGCQFPLLPQAVNLWALFQFICSRFAHQWSNTLTHTTTTFSLPLSLIGCCCEWHILLHLRCFKVPTQPFLLQSRKLTCACIHLLRKRNEKKKKIQHVIIKPCLLNGCCGCWKHVLPLCFPVVNVPDC